jgi:hypothetical protein
MESFRREKKSCSIWFSLPFSLSTSPHLSLSLSLFLHYFSLFLHFTLFYIISLICIIFYFCLYFSVCVHLTTTNVFLFFPICFFILSLYFFPLSLSHKHTHTHTREHILHLSRSNELRLVFFASTT